MALLAWTFVWLFALLGMAYFRPSLRTSTLGVGGLLLITTLFAHAPGWFLLLSWLGYGMGAMLLNQYDWRRQFVTGPIFRVFRQVLPKMSETEKTALEASTPWWESEFFKGNPDWAKLFAMPKPTLTPKEQDFLDGPVDEICRMTNNWHVAYERQDLPPEVWSYLKSQGFMGFMIPNTFGGLGLSGLAHSHIATKIASHCPTLSTTVSVPNTLGPAELLLHYGTQAQKDYYLPRLAQGEDIPCFALTGPDAGSDASAIPDTGIVCRGTHEGKEIIGLKLNWRKRYITFAPIGTVLGLAFKLYDPDNLYYDVSDQGITCALIPTDTPGVVHGRRHMPGGSPFQNGPTEGTDVFIPLDWIIGGPKMAGQGWRMLVECLSCGRAITLPAASTGGAKAAALATGAYARIRNQFRTPIASFEGIQASLAKIAGYTYICESTRILSALAVNLGEKPAVPSAIAKYHVTEMARQVGIEAMDVHAGKAVMMGPKNYVANGYQSAPIAITVEGANILTRNMIIFGQGAMRCHPYVLTEITAAQDNDLDTFEETFLQHIGSVFHHMGASFYQGLTGARWVQVPSGPAKRHCQRMTQASHAFALTADMVMATVGGKLKFKENLSARLGDMLSMLYMGSACVKHFHDQGAHAEDLPLLQWSIEKCLSDFWDALAGVIDNLPNRPAAWLLRGLTMPLGKPVHAPKDKLSQAVAQLLIAPNATRDRLGEGVFLTDCPNNPLAQLEKALVQVIAAEPIESRLYRAVRDGLLPDRPLEELITPALSAGLLNPTERDIVMRAITARSEIIAVDDFSPETFGAQLKKNIDSATAVFGANASDDSTQGSAIRH